MNAFTDSSFAQWLRDTAIAGMPLSNVLLALSVALMAYLAMTVLLRVVVRRLGSVSAHTKTHADDVALEVLSSTNRALIALVALLVGVGMLELPDRWASRVSQLWFVVLALQLALWANRFITVGLRRYAERQASPGSSVVVSAAATLVSWGLRTLIWAIVLLAMLSNLGVNITAFIASLGVGGIAIALAAQNVLGDLFASVAIATDKPFEVGDFVSMGSISGTVEHVGVKTTRLRTLSGEQVVISNTELLKQTISNYKRMVQRRIVFGFGVTYDTTPEQAEEIPKIVAAIVQAGEKLRFDRAHFTKFGDSSLDYEVVYIVLDADYTLYMNEQQRINLALMREFAARGIQFAFPTRTVVMAGPIAVAPREEAERDPVAHAPASNAMN